MKKKILIPLIIALIICVPVVGASIVYSLVPASYPIMVNGTQIPSTSPNMNYNGKTYLELRTVLNMMGANTEWDGSKVNISTPKATETQVDTNKLANSVVMIYVMKNGVDVSRGSGVIIDYDEILTCYHVVDNADNYRIIYNDGTVNYAKLDTVKSNIDVAILKPTLKVYKPVKIGDSDEVNINDKVIQISSPKGVKNVVMNGKVLQRYEYEGINEIVTDTKGDHGSSGGALFNYLGELIGVAKAGDAEKGVEFFIPINLTRQELSN